MRYRYTPGAVYAVPLLDGFAYGRMLREPSAAFYDLRTDQRLTDVTVLATTPVHTVLGISRSAFRVWERVGVLPLTEEERIQRLLFSICDPISGAWSLYWEDDEGDHRVRTTEAEVAGLERASVWGEGHVQDRLNVHFGLAEQTPTWPPRQRR